MHRGRGFGAGTVARRPLLTCSGTRQRDHDPGVRGRGALPATANTRVSWSGRLCGARGRTRRPRGAAVICWLRLELAAATELMKWVPSAGLLPSRASRARELETCTKASTGNRVDLVCSFWPAIAAQEGGGRSSLRRHPARRADVTLKGRPDEDRPFGRC